MANTYSDIFLKHKAGDCVLSRFKILKNIELGDIGPIYISSEVKSNNIFISLEMAVLKDRNRLMDRFERESLKLRDNQNINLPEIVYLEDLKKYSVCPICGETFTGEGLSPCHMQNPIYIHRRCYLFISCQDQKQSIEIDYQDNLLEWGIENCKKLTPLYRGFISNLIYSPEEGKTIPDISDNDSLLPLGEATFLPMSITEAEGIITDEIDQIDCYCPYYHNARCVWNIKDASTESDRITMLAEGAPLCFEKGKKEEILYEIGPEGTIDLRKNVQHLEPSCENCPHLSKNDNEYGNTFAAADIAETTSSPTSDTMTTGQGSRRNLLEGIVLSVDPPYEEPPDRDFAKISLGMIISIVLIPVTIIAFILYFLLSVPLRIIGLHGLIAPLNPLGIFGLLAFLGIGKGRDNIRIPVRNFRIRDNRGDEYQVRMKGFIVVGNIMPADRVSIWGKWKRGNFIFHRAYNYRTQSEVRIRQLSIWPKIILAVISLSAVAGLLFYYGKSLL